MRRHRNEIGAVAGMEGLAFGLLLFVFGTLVIVNAWGVIDAKLATSAAAREAGRSFVEGPSFHVSFADATAAANRAMEGHNRRLTALELTPAEGSNSFERCRRIVVTASTEVARIPLPLFERPAGSYTVSSRHTEIVDPYRAGLDGTAVCR